MATSIMTDRGFMVLSMSRVTRTGVLAPSISTAPMSRSAERICSRMLRGLDISVTTFFGMMSDR